MPYPTLQPQQGVYGLPGASRQGVRSIAQQILFNGGNTMTLNAAPSRTSTLFVHLTNDNQQMPSTPTLSGWIFTALGMHSDATNSQVVAIFMGLPDPTLPTSSGTSLSYIESSSSFPTIDYVEVAGQPVVGRVVYRAVTSAGANATSVSVTMPVPQIPAIALIASVFTSGGAGVTAMTVPPGYQTLSPTGGLGGLIGSLSGAFPGTVTFTSSRSSRWSTLALMVV